MDLELKQWLEEFAKDIMVGIAGINNRLDRIENRLDRVEERLDRVEERLDRIEERLDRVEARLDSLEARVDKIEVRLDKLEGSFNAFRTETEKNFKNVYDKFEVINDRLERIEKNQETLTAQMNERYKKLSTDIDKLLGKSPLTCNYSQPSVPENLAELRESAVPYMRQTADAIYSAAHSDGEMDMEYISLLFNASEREFHEKVIHSLFNDINELLEYVKCTEARTPERLKERETLLIALDGLLDRLCSLSTGFPGRSMSCLTIPEYMEKNGFDALMSLWNERIGSFAELESEATALLRRTQEYISSFAESDTDK